MAYYTVELDRLIQANFPLGLDAYPIFDENYRETLNNKLLAHYRFREIGQETPALFAFYLNRAMNEIMPLYNQYYRQAADEYNYLYTTDFTETYTKTNNGSSHSETDTTMDGGGTTTTLNNANNSQLDTEHDTPQGGVENIDNYLSKAAKVTTTIDEDNTKTIETSETGNNINDTTIQNTEAFTHSIQGRQGFVAPELVEKYRATFLNIDMMVITHPEIQSCFMGIY